MKNRNKRDGVKQNNPVISTYVKTRVQIPKKTEEEEEETEHKLTES